MTKLIDLFAEQGASIIDDDVNPVLQIRNTHNTAGTSGNGLQLGTIGGAALDVLVSSASGVVLQANNIEQGFTSTNSTASLSYALRVKVQGQSGVYYVPVYLGKA